MVDNQLFALNDLIRYN